MAPKRSDEAGHVKLLLVFLLGMVVLGLVTERLDRRVYAVVSTVSLATALLYYITGRVWS